MALQSDVTRGSRVTVLANATDLFSTIDQSMPKFQQWLHDAMGINSTDKLQVSCLAMLGASIVGFCNHRARGVPLVPVQAMAISASLAASAGHKPGSLVLWQLCSY